MRVDRVISVGHSLLQECPMAFAEWERFLWVAPAELGPRGVLPTFLLPGEGTLRAQPGHAGHRRAQLQ